MQPKETNRTDRPGTMYVVVQRWAVGRNDRVAVVHPGGVPGLSRSQYRVYVWTAAVLFDSAITASHLQPPISEDNNGPIDTAKMSVGITGPNRSLLSHTCLSGPWRRKVFHPSNEKVLLKLYGYDTIERALLNLKQFAPINIVALRDVTNGHREIPLIGKTDGWIVRKLLDGKATLTLLSAKQKKAPIYSVDLGVWNGCP